MTEPKWRVHTSPLSIVGSCPDGIGVAGHSTNGFGVHGYHHEGGTGGGGVLWESVCKLGTGIGVRGASLEGIGMLGMAVREIDEIGQAPPPHEEPVGVYGYSEDGIGVRAMSPKGTALQVDGKGRLWAKVDSADKRLDPMTAALDVINDGELLGIYGEYEIPPVAVRGWWHKAREYAGGQRLAQASLEVRRPALL